MKWSILALLFASVLCNPAHAQDTIYKKDAAIIIAKVEKVGNSTITYKRFDNVDGPDYVILRKAVRSIVYHNGTVDYVNSSARNSERPHYEDRSQRPQPSKKGRNILSVIPLAYTAEVIGGSINDPGVGISYERLLDDNGHIGLCMPVIISFVQNRDFQSDFYTSNNLVFAGTSVPVSGNYVSCFVMPELKIYPAGRNNMVRYSIGGPFFAQFGKVPAAVYNNYISNNGYNYSLAGDGKEYSMFGIAISNAVNVSIAKKLFLELDANFMVPFSDNRVPYVDGLSYLPILQYALKFGYYF